MEMNRKYKYNIIMYIYIYLKQSSSCVTLLQKNCLFFFQKSRSSTNPMIGKKHRIPTDPVESKLRDRAIRYSGFFGVRETWVLLEISWKNSLQNSLRHRTYGLISPGSKPSESCLEDGLPGLVSS